MGGMYQLQKWGVCVAEMGGMYQLQKWGVCVVDMSSLLSTKMPASPRQYMTQPSRIPILSPVLFVHVGDPYIPPF